MFFPSRSFAVLFNSFIFVSASPVFHDSNGKPPFLLLRRQGNDTLGVAGATGISTTQSSSSSTTSSTTSTSSLYIISVPLSTGVSNPTSSGVNLGNSSINPFLITGVTPSPSSSSPPQRINATITTHSILGTGGLPVSSGLLPSIHSNGSSTRPLLGTGVTLSSGSPSPSLSNNSSGNPLSSSTSTSSTSRPLLGNSTNITPPPILGTGVLPFSSTTTTPPSADSSVTWSGSWSSSSSESSETLPFFLVPTTTISSSEATSEAALLVPLFLALQRDREWITDDTLKSEYIDNVKKTQDEVEALIQAIDPNADTDGDDDCSTSKKRKRSMISEIRVRDLLSKNILAGLGDAISGLVKDLVCADHHLGALVVAITAPVPPIPLIETLTDTLSDLGKDLDDKTDDNNDDNNDESSSDQSSSDTSSTTSATCTSSSTVTDCSVTVSLSTSYIDGNLDSSTVSSITSTTCQTITACSASPTTAYTTVTTAGPTSIVCAPNCAACNAKRTAIPGPTPPPEIAPRGLVARSVWATPPTDLVPRGVWNIPPNDMYTDRYFIGRITSSGATELNHRQTGILSSSVTTTWLNKAENVYVTGLFGCTVVAIVSTRGMWMAHFWEVPSMSQPDLFQSQIITPLQSGDTNPQFTSPFGLADGDGILSSQFQPQIYISTPQKDGGLMFDAQIAQIRDTLTGNGAPWAGVQATVRGYDKPADEDEETLMQEQARSKVLVEYQNEAFDEDYCPDFDPDDQDSWPEDEPQAASWRVWLERQSYIYQNPDAGRRDRETWDATPEQIGGSTKRKRQDGAACSLSSSASASASASASGSSGSSMMTPPPGSITSLSNGTVTITPGGSLNRTTTTPPITPTPTAFTTTGTDGAITSCESSTVSDSATNCAGATNIIGTDSAIASAFSASTSSASAAASWSAAAATPSAGCYITDDDGWGDSAFLIYGINGWSGEDGESLWDQEDGCGIVSGWEWADDGQSMFEGQWRNTQYASFGLSFFKGGCVERAIHSAGGPAPGHDPGQIACQHGLPTLEELSVPASDDELEKRRKSRRASRQRYDADAAVTAIHEALVPNLQAVANGTWPHHERPRTHIKLANTIHLTVAASVDDGPDTDTRASAREALRHMLAS